MKALNDRVIVRPDTPEELTAGGIIIPDTAKDSIVTIYGTVLVVGPKCNQVKTGDRVIYNKYYGLEIATKDGVLLAIREEELLAVDDAAPTAKYS